MMVVPTILVMFTVALALVGCIMYISSIGDHREQITIEEKFTFTGIYFVRTTTDDVYRLSIPMNSNEGVWKRLQVNETYPVILDGSRDRIRGVEFED